jgi:hypothetical protein
MAVLDNNARLDEINLFHNVVKRLSACLEFLSEEPGQTLFALEDSRRSFQIWNNQDLDQKLVRTYLE